MFFATRGLDCNLFGRTNGAGASRASLVGLGGGIKSRFGSASVDACLGSLHNGAKTTADRAVLVAPRVEQGIP
jgi:hypothetical protein